MNKIILTAAMILSTNLYAGAFDVTGQNPDLYEGTAESTQLATAVQPGIGDSYGSSILHTGGYADTRHTTQNGVDEGYGSILIDVGAPVNW
ncbi:MAG: hypothetical protein JAY85_04640 [Candidatus Thiodiazotropha weberae]|uniref:hypothetical protein n=1 Tax=Candidatus Thiodiazotropha endoloripes TaxID=1818881 RepID=UPI00083CB450|nr:hypothetical protein [Candidatus Thiodiazotropha endoloripes]MCG7897729.1 hypothetical protein [Candidatus Thiodiazotropha weberae]MCG7902167.1 hypothetical protein [Candidatus Thiodiazotropha weberae]MCG7913962.1 hypothetical protein [Candidatus Thiodiazotropha weberae]ODB86197.1 hypothetical protein A3195_11170 [Candidatus Thiodiazotropha endoloripes]ODB88231.1 hypothetical protein A3193_04975 [Candidatus Thiodiazotropha endoloripes]